jgi:ribosome-associated heat shock protein Hsp15
VRADKFLWAVRLFKTRALAADALKAGRVSQGDQLLKPSKVFKSGEAFELRQHGYKESYRIENLPTSRVGAALVPNFVTNTTPKEELDKKEFLSLAQKLTRPRGMGRPTKKDRRDLEREDSSGGAD